MKKLRLDFVLSAQGPHDVPDHGRPEVAFAGRSNVGKSSLLNAISASGRPARTGSTPGCTQSLNLYRVNDGSFYLVDLPGYGYAKAPEKVRSRWVGWIGDYLLDRDALRGVVLLVDARHPGLGPDREMAELLIEIGRPYLVALTKSDKLKRGKLKRACAEAGRMGPVEAVSAKTGEGLGQLLDWIRSAVR
jgi:GTP-binding protein